MPYIKQAQRDFFGNRFVNVAETSGELNYQITMVIKGYLHAHGKSYDTINDIVGALEGAKLEFYRRIVGPYEDKKIIENGDVY